MRPVQRGTSPRATDFDPYQGALPHLVSRLGGYCSFCERRIYTNLAVEHIQPKSRPEYAHLVGRWENFLLACVNCNSTKLAKQVILAECLLPDRDNTFAAYRYAEDGSVEPAAPAESSVADLAATTLALVGLDKRPAQVHDANGKLVALERVAQRMEAWATAETARDDVASNPAVLAVRRIAVDLALATGYFSVWMTVFAGDTDMGIRLVDAFAGTRGSGCFDAATGAPITPAPNPDRLPGGGKA